MKIINNTFMLRFSVAIILLAHSIPGIFDNGINNFGDLYLNQIGFAPLGILLAWLIKLSHLVAAFCLIFDKYVKWASIVTIFILMAGIILIHLKEGWFVVGAGRNGVEFNFLLIFVLLTIMFPYGLNKRKLKE
ncbi:DoxX family protein [Maribacter sp.]|uniref:DoxX family protein n=1 Tax=Maribacter sp. TaxID=1897614 RepID=UPI0025B824A1|nr:DoxX family protein [Maribacter sp.]